MEAKDNILPFDSKPRKDEAGDGVESKQDKILRLQKLIDQGEYDVDLEEIAEAILDSAVDLNRNDRANKKNS